VGGAVSKGPKTLSAADDRGDPVALQLVERLVAELGDAGIRYCHWKSNEAIDRSLNGENDLDLLIRRRQAGAFLTVATGLGFRPALPPEHKRLPGIFDLYALDEPSGVMVHIHAHFQLVLGDDMTKNYRLPIEEQYLQDLDTSGLLPLPRPELEYLVFIPRMVLKHCTWDAQLSRKGRLTPSERRELAYLEERIDPGEVERLRKELLASVDSELFLSSRQALERKSGPLTRAKPAREMIRALDGCERRPASRDTTLRLWRRLTGRLRHALAGPARKQLLSGGSVVAVVGGDGSGKTSAVEDLEMFLQRHLVTRRFHMGKPERSWSTSLFLKVFRRLTPARMAATGLPVWEVEGLDRFPGYVYLVRHLLTARDRYRAHIAARRQAARGAVVVCDRYPLAGLSTMDGPRIGRVRGVAARPLAAKLSRLENSYYERIAPPDVLIVMKADPAEAVERRPDQDREFVRRRAEEIYQRDWSGTPGAHVVDANRTHTEVLEQVRSLVWASL
jgi:thymidylate kinase